MEEQMLTCMLYYNGQQRIEWVDGRVFTRYQTDTEDEVFYKVNLLKARTISAVSRVHNVQGEFDVRPPRGDMRSREIADLSKRVFAHIREVTDFQKHREHAEKWAAITGTAVYKIRWDPNIGDPTRYYWTDKVTKTALTADMLSREEREQKTADGLFEDRAPGDLSIEVLSPFSAFPDTSARGGGMRACQWFGEKHYVDIEPLAERFDIDPDEIKPIEFSQGVTNYEDAMAFMSSGSWFSPAGFAIPRDKQKKRTLYVEMWARPSAHYPKGLRLIWAGGQLLNGKSKILPDIDNPYAADRTGWSHLPYVPHYWVENPARFWGNGLCEDMLTPQFYLNEMRSQKIRFARTFGLPNTFVGKDAGLDLDNIEAGGGKIYGISEASATKVQYGPVPQMPVEVGNLDMALAADLNATASQSEVSGDALPGQLRSGSAVRALNEDRFMGLSIPARGSVTAARDCGKVLLALGKMYYGPNRIMQYLGEGNTWVVEAFDGADLINDVVIIGQASITDTQTNQREEMLDAVQAGVFNPQFDRMTKAMILDGLHYNTSDEFVRQQLQAKRACEREIQLLLQNPAKYAMGFPVFDWQDHEMHCETLKQFFYTPEFEQLDLAIQSVLNTNYAQHKQLLMAEQMAQAQAIEALKGAPGQPGQASQPRAK